jgi:hypothetical protein
MKSADNLFDKHRPPRERLLFESQFTLAQCCELFNAATAAYPALKSPLSRFPPPQGSIGEHHG